MIVDCPFSFSLSSSPQWTLTHLGVPYATGRYSLNVIKFLLLHLNLPHPFLLHLLPSHPVRSSYFCSEHNVQPFTQPPNHKGQRFLHDESQEEVLSRAPVASSQTAPLSELTPTQSPLPSHPQRQPLQSKLVL